MVEYRQLEPSSLTALVDNVPTFDGSNLSFYDTSSFIYTLFFVAIVGAAFYQYVLVGIYRMQASESGIRKSNETFKRTTLGLLGVFGLFLIIFTLNKSLLTGDVGLDGLKTESNSASGNVSSSGSVVTTTTGSGGSSNSCESPDNVKARVSSGNICAGTFCGALSGCQYMTYIATIKSESTSFGVDPKLIIVTMCKESKGDPKAIHKNDNGSWDCGLMQINQREPCEANPSQAAITENIKKGVSLMKQKIEATRQIYPGVPKEAGYFSTYNCCADGTSPNSASVSCASLPGFPSVPKWACPVDPGSGSSNMCAVRNYACELSECLKQVPPL